MAKIVLNTETGEYMKEPAFVKLYYDALAASERISGFEQAVFILLVSRMDEKNISTIGKSQRISFAEKHGTTVQYVSNAIQSLKNKGLIKVSSRGEYVVNARIASRTHWDNVVKIIMKHEFSTQGVTRSVEFLEG